MVPHTQYTTQSGGQNYYIGSYRTTVSISTNFPFQTSFPSYPTFLPQRQLKLQTTTIIY